jgi:hypothetical protein
MLVVMGWRGFVPLDRRASEQHLELAQDAAGVQLDKCPFSPGTVGLTSAQGALESISPCSQAAPTPASGVPLMPPFSRGLLSKYKWIDIPQATSHRQPLGHCAHPDARLTAGYN